MTLQHEAVQFTIGINGVSNRAHAYYRTK